MDVEASHPAWLRLRPLGSRTMRDALVTIRTQVEVPDASPDDVAHRGMYRETRPGHERGPAKDHQPVVDWEGRRYVRVAYTGIGGVTEPLRPRHLRTYLETNLDGTNQRLPLDSMFVGTPVRELWGVTSLTGKVEGAKGVDIPADRRGEIERDGAADAAAALRAHLAAEVMVCGDEVYRRFRPVATCYAKPRGNGQGEIALSVETSTPIIGHPIFAVPRIPQAVAWGGFDGRTGLIPGGEEILALAEGLPDDGHDLMAMTRMQLGNVARLIPSAERRAKAEGRDVGALSRIAAELAPWHMRARIGGLRPAEYLDAAGALLAAACHLDEVDPPAAAEAESVRATRRYAETVSVPGFAAMHAVDPGDAEALRTFAP